jgi:hypothetical protein
MSNKMHEKWEEDFEFYMIMIRQQMYKLKLNDFFKSNKDMEKFLKISLRFDGPLSFNFTKFCEMYDETKKALNG